MDPNQYIPQGMQSINNQTLKIARVLISKPVYFITCKKYNCVSTNDMMLIDIGNRQPQTHFAHGVGLLRDRPQNKSAETRLVYHNVIT